MYLDLGHRGSKIGENVEIFSGQGKRLNHLITKEVKEEEREGRGDRTAGEDKLKGEGQGT